MTIWHDDELSLLINYWTEGSVDIMEDQYIEEMKIYQKYIEKFGSAYVLINPKNFYYSFINETFNFNNILRSPKFITLGIQ